MGDDRLMVVRSVTPNRGTSDDSMGIARATRDGSLFSADWLLGLAMEGRIFNATGGSATTPITFGAGAIDTTEPDLYVIVPDGTAIIPLEIRVYMEAFGTSAQFECMAACGTGGSTSAPTGGTLVTSTNRRTDAPNTSNCTIYSNVDASGATYMTTNVSEFWRDGQQFAITKTAGSATAAALDPFLFVWKYSDSMAPPVLMGASQLAIFAASQ